MTDATAIETITEGTVIRVFTVAFSDQADRTVLRKIADASGGVLFEGGTGDIKDVYTSISYLF